MLAAVVTGLGNTHMARREGRTEQSEVGVRGTGHPLTFSLSMPPYLARIRGSRTVARLVPVTVRRVPPLKEEERNQTMP